MRELSEQQLERFVIFLDLQHGRLKLLAIIQSSTDTFDCQCKHVSHPAWMFISSAMPMQLFYKDSSSLAS